MTHSLVFNIHYKCVDKMILKVVVIGVVFLFVEVCTFDLAQNNNVSSSQNSETTVIKNSSILDDTTKSLRIELTPTTTMQMSFQIPESCSNYKVIYCVYTQPTKNTLVLISLQFFSAVFVWYSFLTILLE